MEKAWKDAVWSQFGAAIDMLEAAIQQCPAEVWSDTSKRPEWNPNGVVGFWYLAFHTLFWLDFYLTADRDGFRPPAPFTLDEIDPAGLLPERVYTKEELQSYLDYCRDKCRRVISALDDAGAQRRIKFWSRELAGAELLLYNLRHVQHHAAQLYLLLRQQTANAPKWIGAAGCPLTESDKS